MIIFNYLNTEFSGFPYNIPCFGEMHQDGGDYASEATIIFVYTCGSPREGGIHSQQLWTPKMQLFVMGFCRGVCAFPVMDFLLVFFF